MSCVCKIGKQNTERNKKIDDEEDSVSRRALRENICNPVKEDAAEPPTTHSVRASGNTAKQELLSNRGQPQREKGKDQRNDWFTKGSTKIIIAEKTKQNNRKQSETQR